MHTVRGYLHIVILLTAHAPIDLKVADAFLLTVTEGEDRGLAWIVDLLLESTATIKFSGTNEAGHNGDLMGMTCNTFAHFSLYDSSGTCVFVDIQGELRIAKICILIYQ